MNGWICAVCGKDNCECSTEYSELMKNAIERFEKWKASVTDEELKAISNMLKALNPPKDKE